MISNIAAVAAMMFLAVFWLMTMALLVTLVGPLLGLLTGALATVLAFWLSK